MFTEAGVDQEILESIDEAFVSKIFSSSECGFKRKFINRLNSWKTNPCPSPSNSPYVPLQIPVVTNLPSSNNNNNNSCINVPHAIDVSVDGITVDGISVLCQYCFVCFFFYNYIFVFFIVIFQFNCNTTATLKKSVATLLKDTVRGKMVTATFEMKKIVNTHVLTDLVIEYEFEFTNMYRSLTTCIF